MASSAAKKYWTQRAEQDDLRRETNLAHAESVLQSAYNRAEEIISLRLERFYRRYAKENKITFAEARKNLTIPEMVDLHTSIGKWVKDATSDDDIRALNLLKSRRYVSRQEALLAEIRHQVSMLHMEKEREFQRSGLQVLTDEELHQMYNLERFIGYQIDFTRMSESQREVLLHTGFDGRNYSDKLWYDKEKLVLTLEQVIPQGFILGWGPDKQAAEVAKQMKTTLNSAKRLVRTEGSYLAAQADIHVYTGAGVETYEFFATLDRRTSEICEAMDGKHFKVSEAEAGVNLPPLHQNCRSTTLPDVDMEGYNELRLAKGDDGKYVRIAKIGYPEWKSHRAS